MASSRKPGAPIPTDNAIEETLPEFHTESKGSYSWTLPSIAHHERNLLLAGYIRCHITCYIPPDLILLCSTFYTKDLYSLEDIIDAENGARFTGPILKINGFTFYIEVYPNGTREHFAGQIASFFCLTHLVPTVDHVEVRFEFRLKEIDGNKKSKPMVGIDGNKMHRFDTNQYWKGFYGLTQDIRALSRLTFAVDVYSMNVHFKNGSVKEMPAIDPVANPITECRPRQLLWEVTDSEPLQAIQCADNVFGFKSPIFTVHGVKWYMTFYPNGSKIERAGFPNVYLHIASLPTIDFVVNVRHSQGLQGDVHMRSAMFITMFDFERSSWGLIEQSTYTTDDMHNLNRFLCVAEMVMLDKLRGDELMEMGDDPTITMHEPVAEAVFEWNLSKMLLDKGLDIEMGSSAFTAFGMKWGMTLSARKVADDNNPEDSTDHLIVGLQILEHDLKSRIISTRCTFELPAMNVRYFTTMIFDKGHLSGDWGTGRVYLEDLNLAESDESCTLRLVMELVEVYDDGVCVTESRDWAASIQVT